MINSVLLMIVVLSIEYSMFMKLFKNDVRNVIRIVNTPTVCIVTVFNSILHHLKLSHILGTQSTSLCVMSFVDKA